MPACKGAKKGQPAKPVGRPGSRAERRQGGLPGWHARAGPTNISKTTTHPALPLSALQSGGLASEEKPQEVVGVVDSFLTALQLEGYGLGPQLRVGE